MLKTKCICPLKTLTMTSGGSYDYVTLGSPVSIPTTDTTKYGRTIDSADLPVFSFLPESVKYIEKCGVYGYNGNASSITLFWKSYINGAEVATNSATVDTLKYFSVEAYFFDVSVGDLCQVSVWSATDTDMTVNGYTGHIVPTRILPTSKNVLDVSVTYTHETVPSGYSETSNSREYIATGEVQVTTLPQTFTYAVRSFISTNGYNLSRYGRGDYASSNNGLVIIPTDAGQAPRVSQSQIPTMITYRELSEGEL